MRVKNLLNTWSELLKSKSFVIELIITVLIFVLVSSFFTAFLTYNETRIGFTLSDPVLQILYPLNLTVEIFILIYSSVITALFLLVNNPKKLIFAIQIYSLVLLFRLFFMYLLPLNPPVGLIPLKDPFVELFGTGETLLRDLFFSGHIATLFLLFLLFDKKFFKTLFLISTVLVAIALLYQHVHYTLDIASAPFFVYASYRAVLLFKEKILHIS